MNTVILYNMDKNAIYMKVTVLGVTLSGKALTNNYK